MASIMSLNEYYLENGVLILKNQAAKKVKVIISTVFVLVCSVFAYNSESHIRDESIFYEAPNQNIALINYVSKFNKQDAQQIVLSTTKWAERFELNPITLLAIQQVESTFDKYALNSSGAMGLMQVMVKVHTDKIVAAKKETGNPEVFNVDTNIFIGATIFKSCIDKFKIDTAAFNCYSGSMGGSTDYAIKVKNAKASILKETMI